MTDNNRVLLQRILVFALVACLVFADDALFSIRDEYSGQCGENLSWSFKFDTLTIEGFGPMTDYDDEESVPWKNVRGLIKKAVIKDGATSIGSFCFAFCVSLKSVSIPSSVVSVGRRSFLRCFELEAIDLPSRVISIGEGAFFYCKSLVSFTIPPNVTSIEDYAFCSCSSLASITVPPNITSIGYGSFYDCAHLQSIAIPPSVTSIGMFAFHSCISLRSLDIPPNLTVIERSAFNNCINITNITLPTVLKTIGISAFSHCEGITHLTIPSSVVTIDAYAFNSCKSLSDIVLSNGVQTIASYAFESTNLTTVKIPSSVTSFEAQSFSYCDNLVSIDVDPNNTVYTSVDGVVFKRKGMVLVQFPCGKEGDYVMPDNVTSITKYSFEGAQKVTSVSIPSSVTTIGNSPFFQCTSLRRIDVDDSNKKYRSIDGVLFNRAGSILLQYPCKRNDTYVIPDHVSTLKSYAFGDCDYLKNVTISSSVTSIQTGVFQGCSGLTSMTIPASVTSIGTSPFAGCNNLASIKVDVENPSFADIDGVVFNHNKTKIIQYPCGHGGSYTIPDGVTTVAQRAFAICDGMTSVTIPASVISFEERAFSGSQMAYINFLGSNEPSCLEQTQNVGTTFYLNDVVCVPLNYSSSKFCGQYFVRVDSCEEFVAQDNQCYQVLEWQAEEITVKKRANASLWENRTNNCFEYQCLNSSGGIAWSKCNSSNGIRRMCIDNQCISDPEVFNKDKWGVELAVNITPNAFDYEELSSVLENVTGIHQLSVGVEAVGGVVVRIVVFVEHEEEAAAIMKMMEDKGEGAECSYGDMLCQATSAKMLEKEQYFFVVSNAFSVMSDWLMLIVVLLSARLI